MLGSGLHNNKDFAKIVKKYEDDKTKILEIDLTDFINKNFSEINKALRTIFKNSISLILMDEEQKDRIRFVWKDTQSLKEFKDNPKVTSINKATNLDEDDVTYITIHNILKPNGFKIIAASYPGAQADRVILVSPGTGRRQERKYIDIIAWIQEKDVTSLQENKGTFSKSDVQEDVNELSKYKNNTTYTKALRSFHERFEPKAVKSIIKIGVGFWANAKFTVSDIKNLDLKDLDYFVYITSDMKIWKIWSTGNVNMFKITEGKVNIPEFFDIEETKINTKDLKLNLELM
jgi:hypothetical protein